MATPEAGFSELAADILTDLRAAKIIFPALGEHLNDSKTAKGARLLISIGCIVYEGSDNSTSFKLVPNRTEGVTDGVVIDYTYDINGMKTGVILEIGSREYGTSYTQSFDASCGFRPYFEVKPPENERVNISAAFVIEASKAYAEWKGTNKEDFRIDIDNKLNQIREDLKNPSLDRAIKIKNALLQGLSQLHPFLSETLFRSQLWFSNTFDFVRQRRTESSPYGSFTMYRLRAGIDKLNRKSYAPVTLTTTSGSIIIIGIDSRKYLPIIYKVGDPVSDKVCLKEIKIETSYDEFDITQLKLEDDPIKPTIYVDNKVMQGYIYTPVEFERFLESVNKEGTEYLRGIAIGIIEGIQYRHNNGI